MLKFRFLVVFMSLVRFSNFNKTYKAQRIPTSLLENSDFTSSRKLIAGQKKNAFVPIDQTKKILSHTLIQSHEYFFVKLIETVTLKKNCKT